MAGNGNGNDEQRDSQAEQAEQAEHEVAEEPRDAEAAAEATESTGAAEETSEAQTPPPKPPPDPRGARIEALERMLAEREATLRSYIKAHKKAEGEFEAFKARTRRDLAKEIQAARGKVVERMLDVDENLERTVAAIAQGGSVETLAAGVKLVHKMFLERMAELGLERIDPTGEEFDPTSMEALGIVPVADAAQDNKVITTLRAGFRMGDHEIRPALVQVGRKM